MDNIILKLAEQSENFKRKGDHINSEGLLICGKCGEPRTTIREFPTGSGQKKALPITCRCDREEEEQYQRKIEAQKLEDKIKTLRRSGVMDKAYNDFTFENDDLRNPEITAKCKKFVEHWTEMYQLACGMLFYGDVGGGKSFYAGCIVNALLEQGVPALMTRLSYLVHDRVKSDYPIQIKNFKLIVLDDLGAENISQTAFDLVNEIYLAKIPVICTTNLKLAELKSAPDLERKRVFDRLFERCAQKCFVPVTKSRLDTSRELDKKSTQILNG